MALQITRSLRQRLRRLGGYADVPWGIDLLLTDACNLRCSYCPITTESVAGRRPTMADTSSVIGFLDSVAHFRPMIRFFGGEPFLHPDWPEIFQAAAARKLPITVVTNGTRLEGRGEEIVRSGLLAIGISIDPPATNDAHRGAGTWEQCRSAIGELNETKRRLGSSTPLIEIYSTVHEETYHLLSRWADELRGWDIATLRLQHQIWLRSAQRPESERLIARAIGQATFFRADVDTYCSDSMPNVDAGVLRRELTLLENGSYPFRLEFHPPLPVDEMLAFYSDPDFKRQTARDCTLSSTYAFVDPRGRLYPCLTLDMGNVFEQPFESVWNGRRFRAFRRLLRREQRLPLCERCPA